MVAKFVKIVVGYFMYNNARDVAISIENAFYNIKDAEWCDWDGPILRKID